MYTPTMNEVILQNRLDALRPVQAVSGYHFTSGLDWSGDSAVWVFVLVDESRIEEMWPVWDQLREDIREVVAEVAGSDVLAYVRMRSSESHDDVRRAAP